MPDAWLPKAGTRVLRDHSLDLVALNSPRVVFTGCTVVIVISGTVLLQHGAEEGRRAATLLPNHPIYVIHLDQVVETIAEALPRLTEYRTHCYHLRAIRYQRHRNDPHPRRPRPTPNDRHHRKPRHRTAPPCVRGRLQVCIPARTKCARPAE